MARIILSALALVTLAATVAVPALAEDGPGRGHHRGPRGPIAKIVHSMDDIALTADQEAALDELIDDLKANRPERRERPEGMERGERPRPTPEMREKRKAAIATVEAELLKATPDAATLHTLLDDGPRGEAPEHAHTNLDLVLGFHASLSADQREELVAVMAEKRAERAEMRGKRRGKRGECTADD